MRKPCTWDANGLMNRRVLWDPSIAIHVSNVKVEVIKVFTLFFNPAVDLDHSVRIFQVPAEVFTSHLDVFIRRSQSFEQSKNLLPVFDTLLRVHKSDLAPV
jgi:hypothetical protein